MKKKSSLKDIAKLVGVSTSLVSYVLNNKEKENRVSLVTAAKIRKAAKELNYHPNLNARSLKTNKTRSIGVILADISNPFFANLARAIEDVAFHQDYTVIFGSSDENIEKFEKVMDFMLTKQVDGFIIAPPEGSVKSIEKLANRNFPMVLIDRYFLSIDANSVVIDNFKASFQATNYLIDQGCRRIGTLLNTSQLNHYKDRFDGYIHALKSANILVDNSIIMAIDPKLLLVNIEQAIKELARQNVDALYFHNNTLAAEGLKQLLAYNRDFYKNIKVVVFDQNAGFDFLESFIPYIKQPIEKMASKALTILINQINNYEMKKMNLFLEPKLITSSFEQDMLSSE
ncbi:LacI family DNA-binding transcriptional regulator [Arenibacter latericius]|uniref:LacI family DNA-binding transcriptional regulator n=1 Tax=Arenibacter latericius TaxID=86104 RepID=UPI0004009FA0|nr:LacI family DNA-binding transcriptional regulator [Arenibacter latericius]